MALTAGHPTRVSVIIPTRNRSECLRQALESVRVVEAAAADLDLEIIVADNGSTDDTQAVVRSLHARCVEASTPGASAARNAALRAATGEFIAFLDDDDVWLAGHLRPHLEMLRGHPELGAAVGQVVNTDFAMTSTSDPWPGHLPEDVFTEFLYLQPQLGATVVRRSVLKSVGYFDEGLLSDEDWDWHLRLALKHRIGFVAVPCVLFRFRPIGARDELNWARWPYRQRVLWRNLRRAGGRSMLPHRVLILCLRHGGRVAGDFLASASAQAACGDSAAARRRLLWATRVSLPHVVWAMVRRAAVRATFVAAFSTRHAELQVP